MSPARARLHSCAAYGEPVGEILSEECGTRPFSRISNWRPRPQIDGTMSPLSGAPISLSGCPSSGSTGYGQSSARSHKNLPSFAGFPGLLHVARRQGEAAGLGRPAVLAWSDPHVSLEGLHERGDRLVP